MSDSPNPSPELHRLLTSAGLLDPSDSDLAPEVAIKAAGERLRLAEQDVEIAHRDMDWMQTDLEYGRSAVAYLEGLTRQGSPSEQSFAAKALEEIEARRERRQSRQKKEVASG